MATSVYSGFLLESGSVRWRVRFETVRVCTELAYCTSSHVLTLNLSSRLVLAPGRRTDWLTDGWVRWSLSRCQSARSGSDLAPLRLSGCQIHINLYTLKLAFIISMQPCSLIIDRHRIGRRIVTGDIGESKTWMKSTFTVGLTLMYIQYENILSLFIVRKWFFGIMKTIKSGSFNGGTAFFLDIYKAFMALQIWPIWHIAAGQSTQCIFYTCLWLWYQATPFSDMLHVDFIILSLQ